MTPTQLRSEIEKSGISQMELARQLGVDGSTVRRWLSGRSKINRFAVPQIEKILKKSRKKL